MYADEQNLGGATNHPNTSFVAQQVRSGNSLHPNAETDETRRIVSRVDTTTI